MAITWRATPRCARGPRPASSTSPRRRWQSIDRLVDVTATRGVTHALGAHIENLRTPFVDYPEGTVFQPDEHTLELGRAHLLELQLALREMPAQLQRRRLRDFTVWPVAR
jgi:hypothetical protein